MKYNNRSMIAGLCLLSGLLGCMRSKHDVAEVKDAELTVQLGRLGAAAGGDNYQVRLIPSETLLLKARGKMKEAMLYRMDSCFYMLSAGKKQYPVLVQPIANGAASNFEYLLEFENSGNGKPAGMLVYKDRYLNDRTYQINLKNEF